MQANRADSEQTYSGPVVQPEVFTVAIKRVFEGKEDLPGLPSVALEVRAAIARPETTAKRLAQMIRNDPGVSALLFKYAASPVRRTAVPQRSLDGVISVLGFNAVSSIVMAHSMRNAVITKSPKLRVLYDIAWRRQITKAGLACFLARRFRLSPDDLLVRSLMTEIGSLAVLMAFKDLDRAPDLEVYARICRDYSKSLAVVLLKKWGIEEDLIEAVETSGRWYESAPGAMDAADVINLALYHTVMWTVTDVELPDLESLAFYAKLPESINETMEGKGLQFLESHRALIDEIIESIG